VITVPERIVEKQVVIREIVTEPSPPSILPTPSRNASTQLIANPGDNPVSDPNAGVVVAPPASPAPVIAPDPVDITPPDSCPAPWMMIELMGGISRPAGEIKPGMYVKTNHEVTMDLGTYMVTHVESVQDCPRIQIEFEHVDFVCSLTHKFYMDGKWVNAEDLEVGDMVGLAPRQYEVLGISEFEDGEVIKLTVEEAHTYVCEGLLSHNKPPTNREIGRDLPIYVEFDPWWSAIPRSPFAYGGSFDGTAWFPSVPVSPIEDISIPESPNPTLSAPIILGNENHASSGGGGTRTEYHGDSFGRADIV